MNRLLAMIVLSSASLSCYGQPQILDGIDVERPLNIIGLVDTPIIYSGLEVRDPTMSISLYEGAEGSEVGALRQDGIWIGKSLQCRWHSPQGGDLCPHAGIDYKVSALLVMATKPDGWYKILIDTKGRTAWLKTAEKFRALTVLLNGEHLAYFKSAWDQIVYRSPTAKIGYRQKIEAVHGLAMAETVESRFVNGRLWLHVKLVTYPCLPFGTISEGWVPAVSPTGEVWAWFGPRGC